MEKFKHEGKKVLENVIVVCFVVGVILDSCTTWVEI